MMVITIIDTKKVAIEVMNVISKSGASINAAELILDQARKFIMAQQVACVNTPEETMDSSSESKAV
ncbi:hypothetical protein [Brevibacillus sp. HB1.4B]|uniref:hypothetical protein n=1 Tax=Brevibacillus sp. HB1.4B TaxID=2738845 RepID=UPI001C2C8C43|nr:hypothetical protein [Brevibacillus sp. HB1.4B]